MTSSFVSSRASMLPSSAGRALKPWPLEGSRCALACRCEGKICKLALGNFDAHVLYIYIYTLLREPFSELYCAGLYPSTSGDHVKYSTFTWHQKMKFCCDKSLWMIDSHREAIHKVYPEEGCVWRRYCHNRQRRAWREHKKTGVTP